MGQALIVRRGGQAASGLPKFTYTGQYVLLDDGKKNWRIKFLTSGTLTLPETTTIDLFLVGGGGGSKLGGGAGGGYTKTQKGIVAQANLNYSIMIGAGGTNAGDGGTSSAFEISVLGGKGSPGDSGSNGGSGGAAYSSGVKYAGGSDGRNGEGPTATAGQGQGTTTREFGESTGTLYAGGGGSASGSLGGEGGGGNSASHGTPNTGGGAGGWTGAYYNGGSGIVIIRNAR